MEKEEACIYILAAQTVTTVVPTENIPRGFSTLQTVAGPTLHIARRDSVVFVHGFPVRRADILVSTGFFAYR